MCKRYITIKNKNYPFYEKSKLGNCTYALSAKDKNEMASILEEARKIDNFMNDSDPFKIPEGVMVFVMLHSVSDREAL